MDLVIDKLTCDLIIDEENKKEQRNLQIHTHRKMLNTIRAKI